MKRPKYVRCYTDHQGKERIYYRKSGQPEVSLRGPVFSEVFWIDYREAQGGHKPRAKTVVTSATNGTFNDLIACYYKSSAFTTLAQSTRTTYRGQIEKFREAHGSKPVSALQAKHIDAILGALAETSTAQAHKLRKRLSTLMRLAVKWDYVSVNPMLNAERIKHKTRGYETWSEQDIEAFRGYWAEGTAQRLAFELLLYTGLRRSDVVRLCRTHIQSNFIVITTKKSQEAVELNIPIHPAFRTLLGSIRHNHDYLIITEYGEPRSAKGFTGWISKAAKTAGLPPRRSPHGLRKAACRRLAEAGCSALEIMSITGHNNIKEIETYCAEVNKKRLAQSAITKLASVRVRLQEDANWLTKQGLSQNAH